MATPVVAGGRRVTRARRALVVGRRRPGRSIAAAIRDTRKGLEAAGWTVRSAVVETKGDLRRAAAKAAKARFDAVVAVGGDGAVLQVVQSLAGTKTALGIIPMGTGNLLAVNLGLPKDIGEAVAVITGGESRRIDLGRLDAGGRDDRAGAGPVAVRRRRIYFTVACGIGFDAEVMAATSRGEKVRLGRLAYAVSAMKRQSSVRDTAFTVVIDGVPHDMDAVQILIANFGGAGPGVRTRLEVEPDDGLLDVIVISASGPLGGLLAGWEALRQGEGGESPEGHVFRARAKKIRVSAGEPRLVETDGSAAGGVPVRVSVRPRALAVLVPADADNKDTDRT
jgi:YegS/Rv2252/BmrU family lipid kinase